MAATIRTGSMPNDLLQNFDPFVLQVIVLIPVLDVLVYPSL